jgi:hypothetical protein
MRKALLPLVASLALCGTATAALIATNAHADQTVRRPVMIAQAGPSDTPTRAEAGPRDMQDGMREDGAHRAEMCKEMYAGKVGELAFLEAKLSLSANQAPLFARWKEASLDIAKRRETDCSSDDRSANLRGQRPSVVARLTLEEDLLKRRLADIQAERPALAAFYDSLTPAQKEEFGHGGMRRMAGHMMMGMMGRPHPGMGRMEHGPMGEAPPPPPAQ